MCALRPIDRRFLPHTVTVFNAIGKRNNEFVAVVLRHVNIASSNKKTFNVKGTTTQNAFNLYVDCVNSDFSGRELVEKLAWDNMAEDEQKTGTAFTLHQGLYLFQGEHERFVNGTLVSGDDMDAKQFATLGLRLLVASMCDFAGFETWHSVQLSGVE